MLQSKTPPTALVGTVRYQLAFVPSNVKSAKMKADKKLFYAKVVPWRTLNLEDLLKRMEDERLPVNPHVARMVLLTAMDTIVKCLKEGNRVTIDDYFSFGLSLPGRVGFPFSKAPEGLSEEALAARNKEIESMEAGASDVRGRLTARPWVRCAPALLDAINKDLQITRMGVTQAVPTPLLSVRKVRRTRKAKPSQDDPSAS